MTPAELKAVSLVRSMAAQGDAKNARIRRHLTLKEVASAVGADPSTVYRWETGETVPRTAHALSWARVIGLLDCKPELVA
ncbi:helix-turn-helix transcriptional regulator [Streptomyces sp. S8]|uniref:helix-turn-helix domain-containing protein n=1 Tax=Streptomyces sp. S8 TaxID=1837283 RepID=UPI000A0F52BC|nr:helix-turn-helix transcriptional regulator [Streptomyces sp. S8]